MIHEVSSKLMFIAEPSFIVVFGWNTGLTSPLPRPRVELPPRLLPRAGLKNAIIKSSGLKSTKLNPKVYPDFGSFLNLKLRVQGCQSGHEVMMKDGKLLSLASRSGVYNNVCESTTTIAGKSIYVSYAWREMECLEKQNIKILMAQHVNDTKGKVHWVWTTEISYLQVMSAFYCKLQGIF